MNNDEIFDSMYLLATEWEELGVLDDKQMIGVWKFFYEARDLARR